MTVKELIEKLKEFDENKEVMFKYYYKGTDNDTYHLSGDVEEMLNKIYFTIKWG